jgi:hypothetical protein
MGGNALAIIGVKSKRLNKNEFNYLTKKVVKVISDIIASINAEGVIVENYPHEVLAYKDKETFGDLDLLIDGKLLEHVSHGELLTALAKEFDYKGDLPFKPKDQNDMTFSFGLPSNEEGVFFQVDLIASKQEYFDFQSNYLNWNDLGNLIGIVASSNGFLKYGHDGLKYQFRDGSNLYFEHVLTTDWNKALDFFGYDVETYHKGFKELEDIYEYASSSLFFNKDLYAFENRNHIQRTRDKKRPTYNGFLKWIEEKEFKSTPLTTSEWKDRLYKEFPDFAEVEVNIIKKQEIDSKQKKIIKGYFNWDILSKYKPYLKDKEIGDYLNNLKIVVPNFEEFVLENKENSIKLLIDKKEKNKVRLKY